MFKNLISTVRKIDKNERNQFCDYFRRQAILDSLKSNMERPEFISQALAETISCQQCKDQVKLRGHKTNA